MDEKNLFDQGSKYLNEIGFTPFYDKKGLKPRWKEIFGEKEARKLVSTYKKIREGSPEFYDFKNSNPELSKSFSEFYDGEILRNACNYVFDHQGYFGKDVLEVGCDTGIMSCFLAKTFSESKIVSIDRNPGGILLAKERAEKLGLYNIEFINCSLNDLDRRFDTVFSMRTMHENDEGDYPSDYDPFSHQCAVYAKMTHDYAKQLSPRIQDNGFLCSFERIRHDTLFYSWLTELNSCGCGVLKETYREIECKEANSKDKFQAFVCKNGEKTDPDEIYQLWLDPLKSGQTSDTYFQNFYDLAYLDKHAGKLILGKRFFDYYGLAERFAIFTDREDERKLLLLHAAGDLGFYVQITDKSEKDSLINTIQNHVDAANCFGLSVEEIDPQDENLEGVLEK